MGGMIPLILHWNNSILTPVASLKAKWDGLQSILPGLFVLPLEVGTLKCLSHGNPEGIPELWKISCTESASHFVWKVSWIQPTKVSCVKGTGVAKKCSRKFSNRFRYFGTLG